MDATKGNKGLMGYTGAVYMHLGVITSSQCQRYRLEICAHHLGKHYSTHCYFAGQ